MEDREIELAVGETQVGGLREPLGAPSRSRMRPPPTLSTARLCMALTWPCSAARRYQARARSVSAAVADAALVQGREAELGRQRARAGGPAVPAQRPAARSRGNAAAGGVALADLELRCRHRRAWRPAAARQDRWSWAAKGSGSWAPRQLTGGGSLAMDAVVSTGAAGALARKTAAMELPIASILANLAAGGAAV